MGLSQNIAERQKSAASCADRSRYLNSPKGISIKKYRKSQPDLRSQMTSLQTAAQTAVELHAQQDAQPFQKMHVSKGLFPKLSSPSLNSSGKNGSPSSSIGAQIRSFDFFSSRAISLELCVVSFSSATFLSPFGPGRGPLGAAAG
jgi:hypothetical protein